MAAAAIFDFTKMLITSVRIQLFGSNLNGAYLGVTEIIECNHKCNILKTQDSGGHHLEFIKMLMTSAWIEPSVCNLNCIYIGLTEMGKFHQEYEI
jgi:hypothetical protein